MSTSEANTRLPQDLGKYWNINQNYWRPGAQIWCCTVAIFHASFHPTQGNVVDWSLKASEGESKKGA